MIDLKNTQAFLKECLGKDVEVGLLETGTITKVVPDPNGESRVYGNIKSDTERRQGEVISFFMPNLVIIKHKAALRGESNFTENSEGLEECNDTKADLRHPKVGDRVFFIRTHVTRNRGGHKIGTELWGFIRDLPSFCLKVERVLANGSFSEVVVSESKPLIHANAPPKKSKTVKKKTSKNQKIKDEDQKDQKSPKNNKIKKFFSTIPGLRGCCKKT